MNVKSYLIVVLVVLHLFVGIVSCSDLHQDWIDSENDIVRIHKYAMKIDSNKKKWGLEYRSYRDLLEIISIADKEFSNDTVFSLNDAIAIMIKESRLNHRAINKNDGGKGLGQITQVSNWHPYLLPWYTDPFNKTQNIKAIRKCLNFKYQTYKTKYLAIKRYNGSTKKSDIYARHVLQISQVLSRFG